MMDKNIVLLSGIVGDDAKFGKTQDGKEFYTFSLSINAFFKEMADSTERTHGQTFIRIFVYDKRQLEYIRRVQIHRGQRCNIFGRLASHKSEYKGIDFVANTVICRDIEIVKTNS